MIDWSQWRRVIKKVSHTTRRGETAWNLRDFTHEKRKSGWSVEKVNQYWESLLEDPRYEKEGEGDDVEIWLPDQRKRFRGRVKEVTNTYAEGSKQHKKMKLSDSSMLKDCNHTAMPSHADTFFKDDALVDSGVTSLGSSKVSSGGGAEGEEEEEQGPGKGANRMVDLSTAVPEQYEAMDSMLKNICAAVQQVVAKAVEIETAAAPSEHEFTIAQKMYLRTCQVRRACGEIFLADCESACAAPKSMIEDILKQHPATLATPMPVSVSGTAKAKESAPAAAAAEAAHASAEASAHASAPAAA